MFMKFFVTHFLIFYSKVPGKWRKGGEHGKWIEYDKSGEILSVKKFKRDKLIKESNP